MEHESFVPIPPERLTRALRTPDAVAAGLPGWQPDAPRAAAGSSAEGGALSGAADGAATADGDAVGTHRGRLRLRVAGSTITYRGSVDVAGEGPDFTVRARGEEVRGSGTAEALLRITAGATAQPEPGTTLTFRCTGQATGRLVSYDQEVVEAALRRLLDRFVAALAEGAGGGESGDDAGAADAVGAAGADDAGDVDETGAAGGAEAAAAEGAPAEAAAAEGAAAEGAGDAGPDAESDVVDDLGEPAGGELDDFELVEVEVEVPESAAALDDLVTPAEAAHARRTMIGRSAEEVDHAPPRGRYAPVPAADAGSAAATLRWAAPAAAALVASAVVVGRVLRRRR
jgi:hypothetical protein